IYRDSVDDIVIDRLRLRSHRQLGLGRFVVDDSDAAVEGLRLLTLALYGDRDIDDVAVVQFGAAGDRPGEGPVRLDGPRSFRPGLGGHDIAGFERVDGVADSVGADLLGGHLGPV